VVGPGGLDHDLLIGKITHPIPTRAELLRNHPHQSGLAPPIRSGPTNQVWPHQSGLAPPVRSGHPRRRSNLASPRL